MKCVIFDMDGLMFDTERINGDCLKLAAKEFGYTVTDEIRLKLLGRNKIDCQNILIEHLGKDYPIARVSELSAQIRKDYIEENGLPIKEGLIELLQYLKEKHILVTVASSSQYQIIEHYLKLTNIYDYIDYIISGDKVTNSKPDPEIFLKVIEHFHLNTKDALVLEDSESGILAAHHGHIPVICIPDLIYPKKKYQDMTLVILKNLKEVITYLKSECY